MLFMGKLMYTSISNSNVSIVMCGANYIKRCASSQASGGERLLILFICTDRFNEVFQKSCCIEIW